MGAPPVLVGDGDEARCHDAEVRAALKRDVRVLRPQLARSVPALSKHGGWYAPTSLCSRKYNVPAHAGAFPGGARRAPFGACLTIESGTRSSTTSCNSRRHGDVALPTILEAEGATRFPLDVPTLARSAATGCASSRYGRARARRSGGPRAQCAARSARQRCSAAVRGNLHGPQCTHGHAPRTWRLSRRHGELHGRSPSLLGGTPPHGGNAAAPG